MSGDSSEEKNQPASAKKLQDARKKGNIPRSTDFVTAVTTPAMICYVWFSFDSMSDRLATAMAICEKASKVGFDAALRELVPALASCAASILVPVVALSVGVTVVANVFANGGPLFTLEPLTPKFESIDPIKGFGKLVKLKAVIEVLKSIFKAVVFFWTFTTIAMRSVGALASLPACGTRCMGPAMAGMFKPLVGSAFAIYVAVGLADFLLQKWIYMRDQKMTLTEVKKERKESDGNPQIKGAIRRQRNESSRAGKQGVTQATLMVCSEAATVGLRFVQGETELPVVVCRGRGERAAALNAIARERGMATFWDEGLALGLSAKLPLGSRVPQHLFRQVAQALFISGALRQGG